MPPEMNVGLHANNILTISGLSAHQVRVALVSPSRALTSSKGSATSGSSYRTGRPFSAEIVTTTVQTLADGTQITTHQCKQGYGNGDDADLSVAREKIIVSLAQWHVGIWMTQIE
jgi:hypothetical protein